MPHGQLYQVTFQAEGEVRDADGNLIETVPITAKRVVSEEEAQAIAERLTVLQEIADDSGPLSSEPG